MPSTERQWFVMRDLKRRNCNSLAVHSLAKAGLEVFSPMTQMVMNIGGRVQRREVPVIQDLLFVHESKSLLDPFVEACATLQYRYLRGHSVNEPMTVPPADMERFIHAVGTTDSPLYYKSGEITESMRGKTVRIVGGPLDGYEGRLLSIKGMRKRRLIIEIPDLIAAAVEVSPEFIQILT